MTKKLFCWLWLSLLLQTGALAQTQKIKFDPFIWSELQVDYFLPDQSFFFFRNHYRHNTDSRFPGIKESGALSKFYQVFFQLGYDQKLSDHWRAAVSVRHTFDARNDNEVYLAYLQHNGKIGSVDFIKRFSYDIMDFKEGDSRGRFRPRAAIERNFNLGKHVFRPSLSYELFFYHNFNSDPELVETRLVDRTRLRAALNYKVSSFIWITPYFMKQTEYFNVLSTFSPVRDANGNPVLDDDGNPVLVENKGGKRNRIEPVFGLDLRFIIPGKNTTENTVPNLGTLK